MLTGLESVLLGDEENPGIYHYCVSLVSDTPGHVFAHAEAICETIPSFMQPTCRTWNGVGSSMQGLQIAEQKPKITKWQCSAFGKGDLSIAASNMAPYLSMTYIKKNLSKLSSDHFDMVPASTYTLSISVSFCPRKANTTSWKSSRSRKLKINIKIR